MLVDALRKEKFEVKTNSFEFPASISQNTLLYSLMLSSPERLTRVDKVITEKGFKLFTEQAMTEGNHWYTQNSLALFLYSTQSPLHVLLKADLARTYIISGCKSDTSLTLHEDGSYQFSGNFEHAYQQEQSAGTWLFRQRPYIELRATGADLSTQYFEASTEYTHDQISALTFIRLKPLQSELVPSDCEFEFALRE